jgi:dynein heavy chain
MKPFLALDSSEIEEMIQKLSKKVNKLAKEVKGWNVFAVTRDRIAQTKRTIPLLQDLKNPALRSRHWNQLMDEVGKPFDPESPEFSLEKIISLGFDQHAELISNLSAAASKELSIEEGLKDISQAWSILELDIGPYKEEKGYYRIKSTDAIFELLEDNQVTLSSMKASKFFLAFEKDVDYWEMTLFRVVEIIEIVLQVQRQWMYLENIFVGTEDIRKQLPKESSSFDTINKKWKSILQKMRTDKLVLKAINLPNILEDMNDMNTKLEKIQKSLDMYLETKRQAFPRFYFISNDDLLEILGQAKDPMSIQPHLKKCFDNLYKLELALAGSDNRRQHEATGMHSGDGEYVPFTNAVTIDGKVNLFIYRPC